MKSLAKMLLAGFALIALPSFPILPQLLAQSPGYQVESFHLIGGSGRTAFFGIAKSADYIYAVGVSRAPDFPVLNAAQAGYGGDSDPDGAGDIVVVKASHSTGEIQWATYLGGSETDFGNGIDIEADGNIVISGWTRSDNFPTTPDAFQTEPGGLSDGIIARFSPDGQLLYSTRYGGSGDDQFSSIKTWKGEFADNSITLAGFSNSPNFAILNAADSACGCASGNSKAVLVRFNPDFTLKWATYLGTAGGVDVGTALDVDGSGSAFIAGWTTSSNFPRQPFVNHQGGRDAFVTRFDMNGGRRDSSLFGGSGNDMATAVYGFSHDNVFVVGTTTSQNLPVVEARVGGLQLNSGGGASDGFLFRVNSSGFVRHAGYFGGPGDDEIRFLQLEGGSGPTPSRLHFGGVTSGDLPTGTQSQSTYGGGVSDGFLGTLTLSFTFTGEMMTAFEEAHYVGGAGADAVTAAVLGNEVSPPRSILFAGASSLGLGSPGPSAGRKANLADDEAPSDLGLVGLSVPRGPEAEPDLDLKIFAPFGIKLSESFVLDVDIINIGEIRSDPTKFRLSLPDYDVEEVFAYNDAANEWQTITFEIDDGKLIVDVPGLDPEEEGDGFLLQTKCRLTAATRLGTNTSVVHNGTVDEVVGETRFLNNTAQGLSEILRPNLVLNLSADPATMPFLGEGRFVAVVRNTGGEHSPETDLLVSLADFAPIRTLRDSVEVDFALIFFGRGIRLNVPALAAGTETVFHIMVAYDPVRDPDSELHGNVSADVVAVEGESSIEDNEASAKMGIDFGGDEADVAIRNITFLNTPIPTGPTTAYIRTTITFEIGNDGPGIATGIRLQLNKAGALNVESAESVPPRPLGFNSAQGGDLAMFLDIGSLNPMSSLLITLICRVEDPSREYDFRLEFLTTTTSTDPEPENNDAIRNHPVPRIQAPDLVVVIPEHDPLPVGTPTRVRANISNKFTDAGSGSAVNPVLSAAVRPALGDVLNIYHNDGALSKDAGGNFVLPLTIVPGATVQVEVEILVSPDALSRDPREVEFALFAVMELGEGQAFDRNIEDNEGIRNLPVALAPDMRVTLLSEIPTSRDGGRIALEYEVANIGGPTTTQTELIVTRAGMSIESAFRDNVIVFFPGPVSDNGTQRIEIGQVQPGNPAIIRIIANIDTIQSATIAVESRHPDDFNIENNQVSISIPETRDIEVTLLSGNTPIHVGELWTVQFQVRNVSSSVIPASFLQLAIQPDIVGALPPGSVIEIEEVEIHAEGLSATEACLKTLQSCALPTLQPGATLIIDVYLRLTLASSPETGFRSVDISATAILEGDPTPENNSAQSSHPAITDVAISFEPFSPQRTVRNSTHILVTDLVVQNLSDTVLADNVTLTVPFRVGAGTQGGIVFSSLVEVFPDLPLLNKPIPSNPVVVEGRLEFFLGTLLPGKIIYLQLSEPIEVDPEKGANVDWEARVTTTSPEIAIENNIVRNFEPILILPDGKLAPIGGIPAKFDLTFPTLPGFRYQIEGASAPNQSFTPVPELPPIDGDGMPQTFKIEVIPSEKSQVFRIRIQRQD